MSFNNGINLTERYTYNFPTTIRFGNGVSEEIGPHLIEQHFHRPMFVTDKGMVGFAFVQEVLDKFKAIGLETTVFTDMDKNPVKSNVLKGVEVFLENQCDCIIGFGGGVSIDVARAIALKANHPDNDLFDFDDAVGGDQYVINPIPYFVAVPTTAGTGSEVGRSTVISEDETHQKRILFSPDLMPSRVFADPQLTMNLPPHVTAATGLDALTHNLEAYVAKGFHPICEGIALEGMRLIFESLEEAVNRPTLEARTKMMAASTMGAIAFQKGLGVVHSLAHPLSTVFDTHHGLANGIMLRYGVEFNRDVIEKKILYACRVMGLKEDFDAFLDLLKDLNTKIQVPLGLKEIGADKKELDRLVELACADVCHLCNPKEVSAQDFKKLYEKAFE